MGASKPGTARANWHCRQYSIAESSGIAFASHCSDTYTDDNFVEIEEGNRMPTTLETLRRTLTDKPRRSLTNTLKHSAIGMGERIHDLSDGRYGLAPARAQEEQTASRRQARLA